jgi:hypothetical protein
MTDHRGAHLDGTGYAAGPVTKVPNWHGLVVWDILFNNLTTGLFLAAALGELAAPAVFTPLAKAAYPLALIFLTLDLVCLVLDLGDPWRFHHMLRMFKPTSPMSLGTWFLTIYSLPLTVVAGLSFLPVIVPGLEFETIRKLFLVLGIVPALGSAVYKGVLISTNSQPGWRDARWLGGYFTSSGLMLGCAELLVLALFLGQAQAIAVLRPALAVLLVLHIIAAYLLAADLNATLKQIYSPRQLWTTGAVLLVGGTLLPLGLVLVSDHAALLLAAVLFMVVGAFVIRQQIVYIPHDVAHHAKIGAPAAAGTGH